MFMSSESVVEQKYCWAKCVDPFTLCDRGGHVNRINETNISFLQIPRELHRPNFASKSKILWISLNLLKSLQFWFVICDADNFRWNSEEYSSMFFFLFNDLNSKNEEQWKYWYFIVFCTTSFLERINLCSWPSPLFPDRNRNWHQTNWHILAMRFMYILLVNKLKKARGFPILPGQTLPSMHC